MLKLEQEDKTSSLKDQCSDNMFRISAPKSARCILLASRATTAYCRFLDNVDGYTPTNKGSSGVHFCHAPSIRDSWRNIASFYCITRTSRLTLARTGVFEVRRFYFLPGYDLKRDFCIFITARSRRRQVINMDNILLRLTTQFAKLMLTSIIRVPSSLLNYNTIHE